MDPIHKDALKKCRTLIVRDLTPEAELWDMLVEHDIFTPMMMEYIQAEKTRSDKNRKLLDDLARRGPEAYGKFLICLRNSGHVSIANTIVENERIIRRQRDPNSSEPVPATPGNEGQILFSGAETTQPLPRNYRNQNLNSVSSRSVIGQETNFASNQTQLATGLSSNISHNPSQQMAETSSSQGVSRDEEMMLLDEDVQDGIQSPPGSTASAGQATSATQSAQPGSSGFGFMSQQSLYERDYTRDPDAVYKMDSTPRGYALIINNKNFNRMSCRVGTDVDCTNLTDLFEYLGFEVRVKHDLTGYEMVLEMNMFAHEGVLGTVDSLAVVILSHGHENETIYGVDGRYIKSLDVVNIFSSQNCPAMYRKPKMIMINACRGAGEDLGSTVPFNESDTVNLDVTTMEFPDDQQYQSVQALNQRRTDGIPTMQDFLIAYSTFPGHVSIRNTEQGSWFIQHLCDVFQKDAHEQSVMDMLTTVNRRVANCEDLDSSVRQIPAPTMSMVKRWLLNPPLYQSV